MSTLIGLGIASFVVGGVSFVKRRLNKKKKIIDENESIPPVEEIEEEIGEKLEKNEVIERKIDTYFKCRYCNKNIDNKDVHWIFFLPYCDKFCYDKFLFEKNK